METTLRTVENGSPAITSAPPEQDSAVESAGLTIYAPDQPALHHRLSEAAVAIGRSTRAGNDIVLETDLLCSKRHAAIERDRDGRYTLYDLGSTNGSKVNGARVDNRTLCDGDEIVMGQTRILFEQTLPSLCPVPTAEIFDTPAIPAETDPMIFDPLD